MVAAMSSLVRSARPCVVGLLALSLVLGINGLEGAIHSVHHLSAPEPAHPHETDGHAEEQGGAPAGALEETCHVAAAASHLAATAVEALPVIGPSTAEAGMVPLGLRDAPRRAWREPARGRAPPSSRPLPG
jgi:hypothetical protein